ncbi:MAG: DNA-3-methyladenine glycosylase 2 family protein [Marinobacter sp.]|uniref:DNA-3-methyladenine glycosylase n=1 Tax=Marinobacter sp. TaxID=50741 RepID=UPI0034A0A18A
MYRSLTQESLCHGAEQLAAMDPDLERLYRRLGTPPLWAREPGFTTLVQIILEQQVSLKAARTMFQRLSANLGEMSPQSVMDSGEAGLRSLGLTRQKARYCYGLAERVTNGQLPLEHLGSLSDDEGRAALLALPGLGPWSVDVYYLMALRRPDVWPQGDLALAAALQDVKDLNAPATRTEQQQFAEAWSPWRAVAARMLWAHYLDARGQV